MDLSKFDGKYVRVTDIFGETFTGIADYASSEFLKHEYGNKEENGIFLEDVLLYESQISSIEEIEPHGTAELWTEHLILRRVRPGDAEELYKNLGTDPVMYQYSGWNPYATLEMAQETVRRFIEGYKDDRLYSWVIEAEDVLFGTIGAYDYQEDRIEVGFSIFRICWGRGYATEALKKVLEYLTKNEGIPCVTAWCAADNIGSRCVLEKAGMKLVSVEKNGLVVGEKSYDKLNFEFRRI